MRRKIFLILAVFFSLNSWADDSYNKYKEQHQAKQEQLFAALDYCSAIGSQEIFSIGSKSLQEIETTFEDLKKSLNDLKTKKSNCFDNSKNFLDDIIADNLIALQDKSSLFIELQNKIDIEFAELILMRKNINSNLIDSILNDIEESLKANSKKENKEDILIVESKKTQELIKQELNIIYDSMSKQLKLDQSVLDLSDSPTIFEVADVSLRSAFIDTNKAMLLFENIEQGSKTYNISKIRTFIDAAYNKLLELKSFSSGLDNLDEDIKKDINKLIEQLSLMSVDLDVSIKDLLEDSFSEDFFAWAGLLYQQTSESSSNIQNIMTEIHRKQTNSAEKSKESDSKKSDSKAPAKKN